MLAKCNVTFVSFCSFFIHPRAMTGVSLVAQMVKNLAANAGDPSSSPGLGRSPGEGNRNPL